MATSDCSETGDDEHKSKDANYDPTLDFTSELFDPLKALTTPGVVPPNPNAKKYDNLAQWESAQQNRSTQQVKVKPPSSKTVVIERKWLPHQLPIKVERAYSDKSVLTRMDVVKGPLMVLKKCTDERIPIKVWTRHSHDVRGYCLAYVTIFDKHWNMVLEDVTEVWKRSKRLKIPAGLDPDKSDLHRKIVPPPVIITGSDEKTETCKRHVDQLLLRGEHIAYIVVLPKSDQEKLKTI